MNKFIYICLLVLAQLGIQNAQACFFPDFYKEIEVDKHGRTLQEIWNFSYDELEGTHNYIQTIFPCPWKGVDKKTDAITEQEIGVFLRRPELRDKVFKSFTIMADFYGYKIIPGLSTNYIIPNSNFKKRTENWTLKYTHNHRRIRRILTSLRILGLPNVSKEFYHALVQYVPHHYISDAQWSEWKENAGL